MAVASVPRATGPQRMHQHIAGNFADRLGEWLRQKVGGLERRVGVHMYCVKCGANALALLKAGKLDLVANAPDSVDSPALTMSVASR